MADNMDTTRQFSKCLKAAPKISGSSTNLLAHSHRAVQAVTRKSQPFSCQSHFRKRLIGKCFRLVCNAAATVEYGALSDLGVSADTYLVLGLAHCFEKNEEGKLSKRMVIEPIAANSLECMVLGAKTCFKAAFGTTMEKALQRDKSMLPEEFQEASYCNEFPVRCGASARTWKRPHAMDNLLDLVPLGQTKSNFNFNLDEKRVLNFENEVSDSDNIKQDMSIDVYGRKDDEDKEEPKAAAKVEALASKASGEDDDDDLDSLLSS